MDQLIKIERDWAPQLQLLRQQIQRSLTGVHVMCPFAEDGWLLDPRFQSDLAPTDLAPTDLAPTDLISTDLISRPAIAVCASTQSSINWVIEIVSAADAAEEGQTIRAQYYAECGIAEYWSLAIDTVALRTYRQPTATGYQQRRLFHAGDVISPQGFPQITLQVQEPLPLYFLTRTAAKPKAYASAAFPLRLRD